MKPLSSRLEQALKTMIQVVSERPDGESFVPIVLHLERQIAASNNAESEFERILRLAGKSAA